MLYTFNNSPQSAVQSARSCSTIHSCGQWKRTMCMAKLCTGTLRERWKEWPSVHTQSAKSDCCCSQKHQVTEGYRKNCNSLGDTQRQARQLISGPCLGNKARFLSFDRTQSRAITGLLTGCNTLRRHLYLTELSDSPLCTRCAADDETSAYILCQCEALASLRHVYLGSFFLEPEDIKSIRLGAIWNFSKVTGLPRTDMGHKVPVN
jgi:hypothetical protein